MPLNVPLVDTFAPSRDAFGQLQNALASGPAFQMNKLKLGAAQDERAELRELQQLMAQTPQEKRPEVAIQYLESKGHVEEAAKLRHVRQQLFDQLYERDPQAATRQFPELGVDPSAGMKVTTGAEIPGTRKFPIRLGGQRPVLGERDKTQAELDAETRSKKVAELSVTGNVRKPGDVIEYPDPATGGVGFRETIPDRAIKPDQSRSPHEDWMAAFEAEKGRKPTTAEMDARERSMRTATTQLKIDNAPASKTVDPAQPLSDPSDERIAQLLAIGKSVPSQLSKRQGSFNHIVARASYINPELDIAKAQADFQAGISNQKMIRSLDAVDKGLNTVLAKSKAFARGEVGILNNIILKGEVQFNDKRAIQFQTAVNAVIDDLASALSGGGSTTDQARNQAKTIFNSSYSQGGLESAVEAVREVMASRRESFAAGTTYEKKGPKPGSVEQGYRFKGGDPSKKENWEKI